MSNGDNPLCKNSCELYSLSSWNWKERKIMCSVCQSSSSKEKRRLRGEIPEEEMTRLRPYDTLSPDSKKRSYKRYQAIVKVKSMSVLRIKSFIQNCSSYIKFATDSSVKEMVTKAFDSILKEPNVAKELINKVILEIQLDGESTTESVKTDCHQSVNVLME